MIKLALIGKNIQHSKSPDIYRKLLGNEIQYDLLDFLTATDIPSVKELLGKYNGVSITSPYKKHFLGECELTIKATEIDSINCLGVVNGIITGENTDYLAIMDTILDWIQMYKKLNVVILGDGVMSNVTQLALSKCSNISFKVFSRKISKQFDQLNIMEIFNTQFEESGQQIVINTCSRDFIFNGQIDKKTIFWDYNYKFHQHSLPLSSKTQQYIDGYKMLELQARYALAFWSIKPFDLNN